MKLRICLLLTALKVLLLPAYRSTDFEVHRNWLAITTTLPLSKWYTEATSEWTLDYPPFFAWFEWGLGQLARIVDPGMLVLSKEGYASEATVVFQRCSVIATDLVLLSAAWFVTRKLPKDKGDVIFFLVVANPALLIVDHIHFQYNGLLLGLLLWSIALIREGHDLAGGLVFAVLLNMKHLFACLGPLYFVYLLRHYCRGRWAFGKFCLLGAGVSAVFAASFGPFVALGQMGQLLSRLFPFGRGLCHAYWAANIWALYSFLDKVLVTVLPRFGIHVDAPVGHMTGGLVQVSNTAVLPQVGPGTTLLLVLATILPSLVSVWRNPQPASFARAAAYSCMCSFMAGYHVHEKAALLVTVVFALDALESVGNAGLYAYLSTLAHYALLPLLFTTAEYPLKMAIFLTYTLAAWSLLSQVQSFTGSSTAVSASRGPQQILSWPKVWVLLGLVGVEAYTLLHPFLLGDRLPFLPLMMTSVYCAGGLVWGWYCLGWPLLPSLSMKVRPPASSKREARSPRGGKPKKLRQ